MDSPGAGIPTILSVSLTSPARERHGRKVSIFDSDHLFFKLIIDKPATARQGVWKSFVRGHNPILMDNIFKEYRQSRSADPV